MLVLRPGDSNFCALSESALSKPELVRRRRRSRGEETGEQSSGGDRGAEEGEGTEEQRGGGEGLVDVVCLVGSRN